MPVQTPAERTVQRSVNFVEPSSPVSPAPPDATTLNQRMWQEYKEARAKERDPLQRLEAGRKVLLKYGIAEVDDWK